ncbi:restriction endonuclease [Serinibacter arcticus]|uniref:Restriction endonuclease n=1 Tax=Serinibacter arcticus TaxID=1655435 RepID=A0A2U1ZY16_9MICO|nr:restriction endonuclease [Serinibacter arcticus]PWD51854.1 restriction endonuclease [Serinibacter arcticus]
MTMWGIHNDTLTHDLVDQGFISIGWDAVNRDLRTIPGGRDGLKDALTVAHPDAKPRGIANWAGTLARFRDEMQVGDVVVAPYKPDSTVNIGVITGEYSFHPEQPTHRHRRPVAWKKVGLSRTVFTQPALYEIGAFLTVFAIRKHPDEFLAALELPDDSVEDAERRIEQVADAAEDDSTDEPSAARIEQHTRDVVLERLHRGVSDRDFEELTAALLRAMGYQARTTRYSGDGGIDVIAHRDPFGAEPPIIKVQCKHTTNTIGNPDVQRLVGALVGDEFGLFVTLGSYSTDAAHTERHNRRLRLLGGREIVDLYLEHYDQLEPRWRGVVPLRRVLAVEADES